MILLSLRIFIEYFLNIYWIFTGHLKWFSWKKDKASCNITPYLFIFYIFIFLYLYLFIFLSFYIFTFLYLYLFISLHFYIFIFYIFIFLYRILTDHKSYCRLWWKRSCSADRFHGRFFSYTKNIYQYVNSSLLQISSFTTSNLYPQALPAVRITTVK